MSNGSMLPRRVARWSLLLAALLQFGVAVVGPSGHFTLSLAGERAGMVRTGEPAPDSPVPHSENSCAVCHSLASAALPILGAVLPAGAVVPQADLRTRHASVPPVPRAPTRARAPPIRLSHSARPELRLPG